MVVAHQGGHVSEDVTLDAFAEPESTTESTGSVDSVAVTSSWAATSTCPDCGADVPRLWQDGDVRVCTACKTWHTTGEGACDR